VRPDGQLAWRFNTREWVISSPAVGSDGTIYVGSYNQNIYALSPAGEVIWKYKTDKYVSSSATLAPGGTLYIGSDDNYLYALKYDAGGLARSSWPRFRGNLQNSGNVAFGGASN
jgi:outer membrane protein assembly factor BamB